MSNIEREVNIEELSEENGWIYIAPKTPEQQHALWDCIPEVKPCSKTVLYHFQHEELE